MAAVQPPFMPSPNSNLVSAFSPYSDSPSSPAPYNKRYSADSTGHLQPQQRSSYPLSPSDVPDPSPIASSSTGTDSTDIDDSAQAGSSALAQQGDGAVSYGRVQEAGQAGLQLHTQDTTGKEPRSNSEDYPSSVILAPKSFETFHAPPSPSELRRSTPTPSQRSEITITSPQDDSKVSSPLSPPSISTNIPPARDWSATPRAQTRQEAEASEQERSAKLKSRSLDDIPEAQDGENQGVFHEITLDSAIDVLDRTTVEITALKLALSECWTLCNTLAALSYIHKGRGLKSVNKRDGREQAWKSCWKLCQKLYETRDLDATLEVRPTLDLCRDFCQTLFEVRQREHDISDSVLRVSFELNNHLYNTHDRTLPEAFRERTLDFYITLCHRLMKQRTHLGEETDALLRACWSLAEMLFSLRQNKREGKQADEELLGSAVQACWELCDLFREGWTQVRPERVTPRPSQTTFTQAFQQAKQSEMTANISVAESDVEDYDFGRQNPETPTTIFEDTQQMSPDEAHVPNILVLGPDSNDRFPGPQWSSSSSSFSGYSEKTTSSTSTVMNPSEDPRFTCLRLLIVKAAINAGFQRGDKLAAFVKTLSSDSFGTAPWQGQLLEKYKKLVASDPMFRSAGPPRRANATDVGRAVQWMVQSGQYVWLKDLFRLVLGFHLDDAPMRQGVIIQA